MRRSAFLAAAAATLFVLGGCAAGGDQPAVCESFQAVRASVDDVRNANVSENGLSHARSTLNQLRADLEQFAADAGTEYGLEIGTVRSAANQVAATVNAAKADPTATTLAGVRTALTGLGEALRTLDASMSETC